ncbi:hypothetical protein BAE44_0025106 [Dichanthelium oligosanthes]|uniref:DOMON domain-containing protein n=1 Tax=Dichanthelium oligosanthes TaxID=888268 RepID=A0A1E5ULW4_9POAL|nr:hypothetical protein BAE44_0025106 [Dichanthelium oligosanthes]
MAAAGTAPRRSASSAFVSVAIVLAVVVTCSLFPPSSSAEAAACSSHTFSGNGGHLYASCADLPRLGATLHYNYTAATNTVAVAFRAPQAKGGGEDGWVAWGINPSGRAGMVGTQAVVAFRRSNGTLVAYPTVLDSYTPSMAPAAPEDLAFPVSGVAAEHVDGKGMVVYATVALPAAKGSKFTHVWQQGSAVVNDVPAAHPTTGDNVLSTATIDFSE